MKNKITRRFITTFFMLFMALSFIPATIFAATEINKVEIGAVKFDYYAGDKPDSWTTRGGDTAYYYDIEYECWEQMENNEKGKLDPVKYWYSDEKKNNVLKDEEKITTFEEGKTYMYSISLKARDGYTFADNTEVYVNSEKANSMSISEDKKILFVTAIKTIKPTVYQEKYIDEVEINNVTVSFKVGDAPAFTGKVSDKAPYVLRDESWKTDGGNREHHSGSMWNDNNLDKLFKTFESGNTYNYGVYFVSNDFQGYFFTKDTKLKINGKYYKYHELDWESQPDVNKFSTMWITTDLTMTTTSTSSEQSEPIKEIKSTGETKATIEFADGISGNYELDVTPVEIPENLANKNVKYIVDINLLEDGQVVRISDTKMRIKVALPEDLKGFDKYEIVYISDDEIQETIPATIEDGYIVFETSHLSHYGIVATNVEEKETERSSASLKTGDNNNAILSASLFAVIALAVLGITIYNKNKKSIA